MGLHTAEFPPTRHGQHSGKLLVVAACALAACSTGPGNGGAGNAIKVEIVRAEDGYRLLRGGEPYEIRGAGLEFGDMASLARHGGNSIRTWTTRNKVETAQAVLDRAHANGLTVALCLPVQSEHRGFDYDDADAVAAQRQAMRSEVIKYRDHPALLAWIIGNELNFDYKNPKVFDAINELSQMIHELDPNHPTTTAIAGLHHDVLKVLLERAPDLDFVSLQAYGQLFGLPEFIAESGYDGPFFVTEWGAIGWWEVSKTEWGASIEMTSSQKADTYLRGYQEKLAPLKKQLIGSYVFLWGQKQERTPTWFGLFTEEGEETEAVDVMHYVWNGQWPENRTPRVNSVTLAGQIGAPKLSPGKSYEARVEMVDPDGDPIRFRWEVKPESTVTKGGGFFEQSIASIGGVIDDPALATIRLTAPEPGAYRLFVYGYDGQGHAAHANIPFLVQD